MSVRAAVLLVLLGLLGGSLASPDRAGGIPARTAEETDDEAAAKRYIANLETVVATRILPGLQRGIMSTAASRPPTLTVQVTDDPSPYNARARLDPDGSLTVRLSLGYMTMHDAALDAAGLAAAFNRPRELREYLAYQLRIARENEVRRTRNRPSERAMTFAEFAGLDLEATRATFAQRAWRARRDRVQIASLGWIVAYFLVRAAPRLAGEPKASHFRDGEAASRLAASAGWFPVLPFATAFQLAAIERPSIAAPKEHTLCGAARLMEAGLAATRASPQWRSRLKQETTLQNRLAEIREQLERMRLDGRCASALVTASSARASASGAAQPQRVADH